MGACRSPRIVASRPAPEHALNPLPWLKIYPAIEDHPKSGRLAKALGDYEMAWAHVVKLWFWASRNQPDGDLSTRTDTAIGIAAGWYDKPAKFAAALRMVGFLDADGQLHDWKDEQGAHAEKFRKDRERAAAVRAEKKRAENAPADPKSQDLSKDSRATIDGASRDNLLREEGREVESEMERGEDLRSKKDPFPPKEPGVILITPPTDGKQRGLFGDSTPAKKSIPDDKGTPAMRKAAKGMEQDEKRKEGDADKQLIPDRKAYEALYQNLYGIPEAVFDRGGSIIYGKARKKYGASQLLESLQGLKSDPKFGAKCPLLVTISDSLIQSGLLRSRESSSANFRGTNYIDPLAHYPSGGDEYHAPLPENFDP